MSQIEETLRGVLEQVSEFRSDYSSNEQAVRTQLIEPVLNALGWKTANPKFVRPNARNEDNRIPDYTLLKDGKSILVVEAKNLSVTLKDDKMIQQIAGYCYNNKPFGIEFGVLTNGIHWLLFNTFEKKPQDRIVWQVDIERETKDSVSRKLSSFSFDNVERLASLIRESQILEKHWNNLITSTDSIVKIVSQELIKTINSKDPSFPINHKEVITYTKNKLSDLFDISSGDDYDDVNTDQIMSNIDEKEFIEVKDYVFNRHQKTKIREKIAVIFPDTTRVYEKNVTDTFVKVISKIGPEKIQTLNIQANGVPLISLEKDKFYNQHKVSIYWIMVGTSTVKKYEMLNEINQRLTLKLQIEKFVP